MEKAYYRTHSAPLTDGYSISYVTAPGGYHPPHWHNELEILYHLNGDSDITIDGKKYHQQNKHMFVIDSKQVHSTYTRDSSTMFICIHISKEYMSRYVPNLELYHIRCTPDNVSDDNFQDYLDTCILLQDLTKSYIRNPVTLAMETEGFILQIFARLIQHFSYISTALPNSSDNLSAQRIRTVIEYVQNHYSEPISLQDAADILMFNKEYFCRFFKKNMNMSFLQYLNEVRAAHVYSDLESTDLPIADIMERNGFTNQKLFNRVFKQLYGCTPSSVRNH